MAQRLPIAVKATPRDGIAMITSSAGDGWTILGVDPGLNTTGYGVLRVGPQRLEIVEAGIVQGTPKASMARRVGEIHEGISDVIAATSPQIMAIEELYSHYQRPRTAILMGHARGVICLAAVQARMEIKHYAATQVKRILTGNGRAPKSQVQSAIQREFGLSELPTPADVADALAIALCHFHLRNTPTSTLTS